MRSLNSWRITSMGTSLLIVVLSAVIGWEMVRSSVVGSEEDLGR